MGLFSYGARNDRLVICRHCGETIVEDTGYCVYCGGYAPGIYSECPSCRSRDFIIHDYGFVLSRAVAGAIVAGPLGLIGGMIGSGTMECICLNCGQGWIPTGPNIVLSDTKTRKFKKLPGNCIPPEKSVLVLVNNNSGVTTEVDTRSMTPNHNVKEYQAYIGAKKQDNRCSRNVGSGILQDNQHVGKFTVKCLRCGEPYEVPKNVGKIRGICPHCKKDLIKSKNTTSQNIADQNITAQNITAQNITAQNDRGTYVELYHKKCGTVFKVREVRGKQLYKCPNCTSAFLSIENNLYTNDHKENP